MTLTLDRDVNHSDLCRFGHTIKKPRKLMDEIPMFSHTQNDNGTYNTRCLYCFMTIASSVETPEELDQVEAHHICPEKALSDLLGSNTSAAPLVHIR